MDWLFARSSAFTDAVLARTPSRHGPKFATEAAEATVFVRVTITEQLLRTQKLLIIGSCPELGRWEPKRAIEMSDANYPEWQVEIPVSLAHFPFEYKFAVLDETRGPLLWEAGANRVCDVDKARLAI